MPSQGPDENQGEEAVDGKGGDDLKCHGVSGMMEVEEQGVGDPSEYMAGRVGDVPCEEIEEALGAREEEGADWVEAREEGVDVAHEGSGAEEDEVGEPTDEVFEKDEHHGEEEDVGSDRLVDPRIREDLNPCDQRKQHYRENVSSKKHETPNNA